MFALKPKKILMALTFFWMFTIFCLGAWWLYLLFKLSHILEASNVNVGTNFIRLIKWEGMTFLILLVLISSTLFYLYLQEIKQTNSVRAFFASLTHELKTPLASMRLQAEVMHDLIEQNKFESIHDYAHRLIDDGKKLELEMDKILHLSRVERGGKLELRDVDLARLTKNLIQKHHPDIQVEWSVNGDTGASVDEFAFALILRNLIDNTLKHSTIKKIKISFLENEEQVDFIYQDGESFKGDIKKLSNLFYKYNSPKGSGIGLYLIRRLTTQMDGDFSITSATPLIFKISLKKGVV